MDILASHDSHAEQLIAVLYETQEDFCHQHVDRPLGVPLYVPEVVLSQGWKAVFTSCLKSARPYGGL